MNHRYLQPVPELSHCLRSILVLDGSLPPAAESKPLVTRGLSAAIFRFEKNEDETYLLMRCSVSAGFLDEEWCVADKQLVIGYLFIPFSMPAIFNIPIASLRKNALDIRSMHPQVMNALVGQLHLARNLERLLTAINGFLVYLAEKNDHYHRIIQYATEEILKDPSPPVLQRICSHLALTERNFQRYFKKYLGIPAGQFRRICQFSNSFEQMKAGEFDSLSDLAYENDFSDQSHFSRTFREFAKTTPKQYLMKGLAKKK